MLGQRVWGHVVACRGRGIMGIGKKRLQSNWTLGSGILGYRGREGVRPRVHSGLGTRQPGW